MGTTTRCPTPGAISVSHPGHAYGLRAWYGWIGFTISNAGSASHGLTRSVVPSIGIGGRVPRAVRHPEHPCIDVGTLLVVTFLHITDDGPVRTITMSNPGAMNAVPADAWTDLADAFEAFDREDVRVLVLTGADGEFCAGADMRRDHADVPSAAENAERMRTTVNRAALALHRTDKPTIAAVDGVAVGAGMNMAIGCDIVVATERARFAEVFVRRGLTLDFGGTWLLPRLVGLQRARELALTGRVVHADEALRIGLVTQVVAPDALPHQIASLAADLAAGAPLAQAFIKRALDRSSTMTFEQALAYEEFAQGLLLASDDLREGAQAFVEKRPPRFEGR